MRFPITLVPDNVNLGFMRVKNLAFIFSILLTIVIVFALLTYKLNLGIDFAGGTIIEINSNHNITEIRNILTNAGYGNAIIQQSGSREIMIRIGNNINKNNRIEDLKANLQKLGNIEWRRIEYVGPKVGSELISRSTMAMVIALFAMMLYVWIRFDWQYSIGVFIALCHDIIATLGFYVFTQYDFDLTSIAALLTILGYSINDSVVIYDRIRENLRRYKSLELKELINLSLNETLSRTVMTVLTTIVACLALVICGGEVLKGFSTSVLFGIIFGTYSSLFISAPILLHINNATKALSSSSHQQQC